jgi:hypothetical protein
MIDQKSIILLARRDHVEAMRVAAGLTIYGHEVRLIFMDRPVSDEDAQSEQAELLELCEIEPETTVEEMSSVLKYLSPAELATVLSESDAVLNI